MKRKKLVVKISKGEISGISKLEKEYKEKFPDCEIVFVHNDVVILNDEDNTLENGDKLLFG